MMPRLLAVLMMLASATSLAIAAEPCDARQSDLVGAWHRSGVDGFFEQMAFSRDGERRVFDSWLHERPEFMDASWQLDGCRLTVVPKDDADLTFRLTILSLDRERLRFRDEGNGTTGTYRRHRDPP